jgi:hypothetical protein
MICSTGMAGGSLVMCEEPSCGPELDWPRALGAIVRTDAKGSKASVKTNSARITSPVPRILVVSMVIAGIPRALPSILLLSLYFKV